MVTLGHRTCSKAKIFAAFVLLGAMAEAAFCRTATQLQGDARLLARDAGSSSRTRFSDSEVLNFLNEGQREVIARTKCIERSYTFQLVTGTTYYSQPSDFLTVRRVTRGNLVLSELTPAALDGRSRGWETATGKPTYYFTNFSSRGLVGFSPFPGTSVDTDTIRMDYFASATNMSSASDVPFNGIGELVDYHQILSYYAATRMVAIDGRVSLATLYAQIYELMLKQMGENCKMRPNYLPSAAATP